MRKLILVFLVVGLMIVPTQAQLWKGVGTGFDRTVRSLYADTVNGNLLAVGHFLKAGDSIVNQVAMWDGVKWQGIGGGTTGSTSYSQGAPGLSIVHFDTSIFVGGMMSMMGGDTNGRYLARWDGTAWKPCGEPDSHVNIEIVNGNLFAMGGFSHISGKPVAKFARWNGADWERFGDSLDFQIGNGLVWCGEYFQGDYFFAGNFETGSSNEIMSWNGVDWQDLYGGLFGDAWVNDLQAYRELLYVGGHFLEADNNLSNYLAAWNGQSWVSVFEGVHFTSQIRKMNVIDDVLYVAGGSFYIESDTGLVGPFNLGKFDGQQFCAFGNTNVQINEPNEVLDIIGLDGELYLATRYSMVGVVVNFIAHWLGGDSVDICISQPVRVSDPETAAAPITLHPNPATSHFTLALPAMAPCTLRIHNLTGQEVKEAFTYHAGEAVDIAHLPAGLYFVEVMLRGKKEVIKLVKE